MFNIEIITLPSAWAVPFEQGGLPTEDKLAYVKWKKDHPMHVLASRPEGRPFVSDHNQAPGISDRPCWCLQYKFYVYGE